MPTAPTLRIEIALSDEAGIYETSTYDEPHSAQLRIDELATTEGQTGQRWPGTVVVHQGAHATIHHIADDAESWLDMTFDGLIAADEAADALAAMVNAGWYSINTAPYGHTGWQCTARLYLGPASPRLAAYTPTRPRLTGPGVRLDVPAGVIEVIGTGITADEAVISAYRQTRRVNTPTAVVA